MNKYQKIILSLGFIITTVLLIWTPWDVAYETALRPTATEKGSNYEVLAKTYYKRHPFWKTAEIGAYSMWHDTKVTEYYYLRSGKTKRSKGRTYNLRYSLKPAYKKILVELSGTWLITIFGIVATRKTKAR